MGDIIRESVSSDECRTDEAAGGVTAVCYHQACPVCGRSLLIRVTLLGRPVYCQHCGGNFIASDTEPPRGRDADRRPQAAVVDELIERAAVMLGRGSE